MDHQVKILDPLGPECKIFKEAQYLKKPIQMGFLK